MTRPDPHETRIGLLRHWRGRHDPDRSLAFLEKHFKQQIARPHRQMGNLGQLWTELVPESLRRRTALASLRNGVLTVSVDSSVIAYQLDRLLRSGLENTLRERSTDTLRKVKLRVGSLDPPSGRRPDAEQGP